jgi:hypothetical protein
MTFNKLAYSQAVLRSMTDRGFMKTALFGRMATGAGKAVWNQAVKHNGALAPLAIAGGAAGVYAAGKSGVAKAQENMIGFDPRVIAAKREMGV